MSSPRQDVLCKMILNLIDAGFETNFTSIYWTYASGFPKAANVSKLVDKRFKIRDDYEKEREPYIKFANYLKENRIKNNKTVKEISKLFPSKTGGLTGRVWNWENAKEVPTPEQYEILKEQLNLDNTFDLFVKNEREKIKKWEAAEREVIANKYRLAQQKSNTCHNYGFGSNNDGWFNITKSATAAAKKLDGSYTGFNPKPSLEVILVVQKPLKHKTFVDQAIDWVSQRINILNEIEIELKKQGIDKIEWSQEQN